ncbi:Hypothetical_protein [Hexamita inflata]|uniref:Hypothetical_protein n=1 Tax=Hexamita inflata TaxID=28002 RepID=A0AA86QAF5_9EUKA|nr:Hypothetical protein HINF_LOCUS36954 [Hexamita inflata]
MKVLLIVLVQNNKIVQKLEITNNYIYTVKKIQDQMINESIIKIHIDHESSSFTSKAGEQHDFYQAKQYRVRPEEVKYFDLIRIQKEFNIIVLDKTFDFDEIDIKPETKQKKAMKKVKKENSQNVNVLFKNYISAHSFGTSQKTSTQQSITSITRNIKK